MPLYEGLSYTADKNVVVLDIGEAYTKCGIAGELCPRCIIPSQLKDEKTGQVRKLYEYNTEDELYENLKDFLFILHFRHLLMSPKDKRVVVCESVLCPSKFRETLARVLFKHFDVGSVMFAPGHLTSLMTLGVSCGLVMDVGYTETLVVPVGSVMFAPGHLTSLMTLGVSCGLVMDVGYTETLVVPVYEGIPVLKAIQALPVAGKAIHNRIKEMLLKTGKIKTKNVEKPVSENPECLTDEILEDIKVRCCFTTNLERAKQIHEVEMFGKDPNLLPTPPPGVEYPLDGESLLTVDGKIREHACEVMYEQDNEQKSVTTLLLDAILQCPIDMRVELSQNIVITGGMSMLPGFLHRIQTELKDQMQLDRYANTLVLKKFKFHRPPSKANYTGWLGGAIFGSLENLPSRSITRDMYTETGRLPDWCVIKEM